MTSRDELLAQLKGIAQHMRTAYSNLIGDAYFVDKAAAAIRSLQAELEGERKVRFEETRERIAKWYEDDGHTLTPRRVLITIRALESARGQEQEKVHS